MPTELTNLLHSRSWDNRFFSFHFLSLLFLSHSSFFVLMFFSFSFSNSSLSFFFLSLSVCVFAGYAPQVTARALTSSQFWSALEAALSPSSHNQQLDSQTSTHLIALA